MNDDKLVEWGARAMCALMFLFMALGMCVMCSCARTVYVPYEHVVSDTLLHTQVVHDSVYVHDKEVTLMKGDTVFLTKWRYGYKERLVHDTLYINKTDSVRVPVPVERELTAWQRTCISVGRVTMVAGAVVSVGLVIYLVLRYRHFRL